MPHQEKHPKVNAAGEITHFRASVRAEDGGKVRISRLDAVRVASRGPPHRDRVALEGEQKPSEIKLSKLERNGKTFAIDHGLHGAHEDEADPAIAIKTAEDAGYQAIGGPRRKPKHFEVLGKKGAEFEELHIELDGGVRKTKRVSPHDHKWQSEME